MSVLASLVRAYERLADQGVVPPFGYSVEKIGFCILLRADGTPAGAAIDLRDGEGRKRSPRLIPVPASFKRPGTTPRAFFLWDNTAFALGVTGSEGKDASTRFAAFRDRHLRDLEGATDAGLLALRRFVESWAPEDFELLGWPSDMKDQNVVFALEDEYRERLIHDRTAARELWAKLSLADEKPVAACLVTGDHAPVARIHPAIKGVWGAQVAGASIVSFNLDAFTSYGHEQGHNAPVSEAAAFAYTTTLNHYLRQDSPNRIQIGDASTVFWADASEAETATEAEGLFAAMLGASRIDEIAESRKVRAVLEKIRAGRPLREVRPDLPQHVRFYVLGLAPNAARLSVRFWLKDDFGDIAQRYLSHLEAMRIDPPPREEGASLWRSLIELAPQRKTENIPPKLAGDWLQAILTGSFYPLTLMATVLMRLRADKDVNALRVAILKSVLVCNFEKEVPVSLDPDNKDPGYLLGRLFAAYEYAQRQALGGAVNATIRDQYYGTASATPRAVFPILQRKATHHLARLRKDRPQRARWLDEQIGQIFELADADQLFVPTLSAQRQAMFAIGYYHQKSGFYRRREAAANSAAAEIEETVA